MRTNRSPDTAERVLAFLDDELWISKSELSRQVKVPLTTLHYLFHGKRRVSGITPGPLRDQIEVRIAGETMVSRYVRKKKRADEVYFCTIGYEGLSSDEFIGKLKEHDIDTLCDVRFTPLSRKKGFSRKALEAALTENDIRYLSFKDLGAPKELREYLYSTGDYKGFFERYRRYINENEPDIRLLIDSMRESRSCLLCFEKDWSKCHRGELSRVLVSRGARVYHLS